MNLGEPCAEAEQQPIDRNETAFDLMRDTIRGTQQPIDRNETAFDLRPTQSEALRGTQRPSEAIRGHPGPSEAIRGHPRSSEAIRGHQRPSEGLEGDLGCEDNDATLQLVTLLRAPVHAFALIARQVALIATLAKEASELHA